LFIDEPFKIIFFMDKGNERCDSLKSNIGSLRKYFIVNKHGEIEVSLFCNFNLSMIVLYGVLS